VALRVSQHSHRSRSPVWAKTRPPTNCQSEAQSESIVTIFNIGESTCLDSLVRAACCLRSMLSALFVSGSVYAKSDADQGDSFTIAVIPDTQNYIDITKHNRTVSKRSNKKLDSGKPQAADESGVRNACRRRRFKHGDGTNGTPGDTTYGAASMGYGSRGHGHFGDSGVPFGMCPGNTIMIITVTLLLSAFGKHRMWKATLAPTPHSSRKAMVRRASESTGLRSGVVELSKCSRRAASAFFTSHCRWRQVTLPLLGRKM